MTFREGENASMVAMLSSIAELPPKPRMSHHNIITHFLIGRSNPNLETIFKKNHQEVTSGIDSFVYLPNIKQRIRIKILAFVSDLIQLPKMINMRQFNTNESGCPICYIEPTAVLVKSKKMTKKNGLFRTKHVMMYDKKITTRLRTDEEFQNLFGSKSSNESVQGVKKGKPFLNYYIRFPDQILLDYMHVCVRGPQELLFDLWFNTKKKDEQYYLGKYKIFTSNLHVILL